MVEVVMKEDNSLKILKLLLSGSPVKLMGYTWYLGTNNELGCKRDSYINDVKQPDKGILYGGDWSLAAFLNECEKLTDAEVITACGEELQSSLIEVRANETLHKDGKLLGEEIGLVLCGIVQNDMYMTQEEFARFGKDLQTKIHEIIAHGEKTVAYIQGKLWDHNVPFKGTVPQTEAVTTDYDGDDDIPF